MIGAPIARAWNSVLKDCLLRYAADDGDCWAGSWGAGDRWGQGAPVILDAATARPSRSRYTVMSASMLLVAAKCVGCGLQVKPGILTDRIGLSTTAAAAAAPSGPVTGPDAHLISVRLPCPAPCCTFARECGLAVGASLGRTSLRSEVVNRLLSDDNVLPILLHHTPCLIAFTDARAVCLVQSWHPASSQGGGCVVIQCASGNTLIMHTSMFVAQGPQMAMQRLMEALIAQWLQPCRSAAVAQGWINKAWLMQ